MYSQEEKAIKLVIKAFEGKKRLKENINASVHSISVGFMLKNINAPESVVIAGLLHDIIEDTEFDYEYIKNNFGIEIADLVLAVSEDKTISTWNERKQEFLDRLQNVNEYVLLIELADKLHNLLSDYELWQIQDTSALKSPIASYSDNKWYYLELKELFNLKLKDNDLLHRYNNITKLYFE